MPKGKKADQRMKAYLIYEYLMRNSDVNHIVRISNRPQRVL